MTKYEAPGAYKGGASKGGAYKGGGVIYVREYIKDTCFLVSVRLFDTLLTFLLLGLGKILKIGVFLVQKVID